MRITLLCALVLCACSKKDAPTTTATASAASSASSSAGASSQAPQVEASAPLRGSLQCAIFGSFAQGERAAAEALRDKLAASVKGVEVRDATDFNELPWGQLLVLVASADRPRVDAQVEVKPCTTLDGSFDTPTSAATVTKRSRDCIGWNPDDKRALCLVGSGGLSVHATDTTNDAQVIDLSQAGGAAFDWYDRKTPSSQDDDEPTDATVEKVRKIIGAQKLVSFEDFRVRTLTVGHEIAWNAPKKVTMRYTQTQTPGSSFVRHEVQITCGGSPGLGFGHDVYGAAETPVRVYARRDGKFALVVWRAVWGNNAGGGHASFARVFDFTHDGCVP